VKNILKEPYECVTRLYLTAEWTITACCSGQLRMSEHWLGMQDSVEWNGWDCQFALLWPLLVLSDTVFSYIELPSQFNIHTLLWLDLVGNQILSAYDLLWHSAIHDMWSMGSCRSLIELLSRGLHSDSISSSSLGGNRLIIYIKMLVLAAQTY